MFELGERRRGAIAPVLGACAVLAVALVVGCIAVASSATAI
jgi:hypothetical protein